MRAQLEADGFSGPTLHTEHLRAEMQLDAFLAQHLRNGCRDVGIFPAGELRSRLDDRDPAAEAAIGLRHFQADISAAQDDQVAGQAIELEQLDIA